MSHGMAGWLVGWAPLVEQASYGLNPIGHDADAVAMAGAAVAVADDTPARNESPALHGVFGRRG